MASIMLTNILLDYLQPIKQHHRVIMPVLSQQCRFLIVSAYGTECGQNLEVSTPNEGIHVHCNFLQPSVLLNA